VDSILIVVVVSNGESTRSIPKKCLIGSDWDYEAS
jgi:hypothetical protein